MPLTNLSRVLLAGIMAVTAALGGTAAARAQDAAASYPDKPIRLIVGFAAGGGNDIFARLVGNKLGEILGKSVVVENRPGAGGRLSAEYVAGQPADGYTLLVGASGMTSVAAAIYPDLKYDPVKTFIPLSTIATFPLILSVSADMPVKTVKDLIAYSKAHSDQANYATTSPAFTITSELFKLKTGAAGVAVYYKSSNEMLLSLMQKQTLYAFPDGPPTIPQVQSGKVRAIAVTGDKRAPLLPDVPSMTEAGFPEVDVQLFSGVFVAAATPAPIVAKLEKALQQTMKDPSVADKLKAMAVNPGGDSSADFHKLIEHDIKSYRDVVKAANLHFED